MHLVSFVLYNLKVLRGQAQPNAAAWSLWVGLTALNCVTYIMMTTDPVKGILPMVSSVACLVTFGWSLVRGHFSRLGVVDWLALLFGGIACLVWWLFRSVTGANLILQVCILISFVPTYRSVWNRPGGESALPWFGWTGGYLLTIAAVLCRWQGQYQDLVYPLVGLVLHGGVGLVALWRSPQISSPRENLKLSEISSLT